MIGPTAGNLRFGGGEQRCSTGFVFQYASLFPWRTVEQNVSYGLELARNRRRSNLSGAAAPLPADADVVLASDPGFDPHAALAAYSDDDYDDAYVEDEQL